MKGDEISSPFILGGNLTAPLLPILHCKKCGKELPEIRREFPWCECGWNLPSDPLNRAKGIKKFIPWLVSKLGKVQSRFDLRWGAREDAGWFLLNGLAIASGLLINLLEFAAFYIIPFSIVLLIVSRSIYIPLLLIIIAITLYFWWKPYKYWKEEKGVYHTHYHAFIDMVHQLADQLGVSKPHAISFTLFPVIFSVPRIQWLLFPRVQRVLVIGLPLLGVLNVSELKVLVAHELSQTNGIKFLFINSIYRALNWLSRISGWVSGLLSAALAILLPIFLYMTFSGILALASGGGRQNNVRDGQLILISCLSTDNSYHRSCGRILFLIQLASQTDFDYRSRDRTVFWRKLASISVQQILAYRENFLATD